MQSRILLFFGLLFALSGCADVDPFSPNLDQPINNNGELENLQNNQNGLMLELGRIRQEQEIQADQIANMQQGLINNNETNHGTQILQGDGALVLVFGVVVVLAASVVYCRTEAKRNKRIAELFAEQMSQDQADNVLAQCFGTNMERPVYDTVVTGQIRALHKHQAMHDFKP